MHAFGAFLLPAISLISFYLLCPHVKVAAFDQVLDPELDVLSFLAEAKQGQSCLEHGLVWTLFELLHDLDDDGFDMRSAVDLHGLLHFLDICDQVEAASLAAIGRIRACCEQVLLVKQDDSGEIGAIRLGHEVIADLVACIVHRLSRAAHCLFQDRVLSLGEQLQRLSHEIRRQVSLGHDLRSQQFERLESFLCGRVKLEQNDGLDHVRVDQIWLALRGRLGSGDLDQTAAVMIDVVKASAPELLLVELAELVEDVGKRFGQRHLLDRLLAR